MPKERLDYLDMAKGVGIFLVILGHIEYLEESAMSFIYSFHMPLFFVIGGILVYIKEKPVPQPKDSIKKRAYGTLIPYISFSLILLTMYVFEYFVQPERITSRELLRRFVDAFTGYGLHTLWFLPVYFGADSLFVLLRYCFGRKAHGEYKISAAILILVFLSLGIRCRFRLEQYPVMEKPILLQIFMNVLIVFLRVFLVLPFFWSGWHFAKTDCFHEKRGWNLGAGALLFTLGALMSRHISILDLHYLYITPAHYVVAAALCIGLLMILKALPVSRMLSYLGRNSLVIMCTHAPMYVLYYISLGMFFVRKFIPMTDPIFCVAITLMVCFAEIPIIWIFNHYFNYLLGRRL